MQSVFRLYIIRGGVDSLSSSELASLGYCRSLNNPDKDSPPLLEDLKILNSSFYREKGQQVFDLERKKNEEVANLKCLSLKYIYLPACLPAYQGSV